MSHNHNCTKEEILDTARTHIIIDSSFERKSSIINPSIVRISLMMKKQQQQQRFLVLDSTTITRTFTRTRSSRSTDFTCL